MNGRTAKAARRSAVCAMTLFKSTKRFPRSIGSAQLSGLSYFVDPVLCVIPMDPNVSVVAVGDDIQKFRPPFAPS